MLGSDGGIIQGWHQGLRGVCRREIRDLLVPSSLAYGAGGRGRVPPNSNLAFRIAVVDVRTAEAERKANEAAVDILQTDADVRKALSSTLRGSGLVLGVFRKGDPNASFVKAARAALSKQGCSCGLRLRLLLITVRLLRLRSFLKCKVCDDK